MFGKRTASISLKEINNYVIQLTVSRCIFRGYQLSNGSIFDRFIHGFNFSFFFYSVAVSNVHLTGSVDIYTGTICKHIRTLLYEQQWILGVFFGLFGRSQTKYKALISIYTNSVPTLYVQDGFLDFFIIFDKNMSFYIINVVQKIINFLDGGQK